MDSSVMEQQVADPSAIAASQAQKEAEEAQKRAEEAAAAAAAVEKQKQVINAAKGHVQFRPVSFHFKTNKDLGVKRPSLTMEVPVPTVDGVISILEKGGKEVDLLLETIADVVIQQARQQVNDKEDITQETLDVTKLTWEVIANLPRAERRGGGIAAETWESFNTDYVSVMPAITGKTIEQVSNAAKLLTARLAPCKTNKKVIAFLRDQLAMWYTNSSNAEEFSAVYEFLDNKADALLKADEAELLKNL